MAIECPPKALKTSMVQAQQVSAVARPLRTRDDGAGDTLGSTQPPADEAPTIPAEIPELSQDEVAHPAEQPGDSVPCDGYELDGDNSAAEVSLIELV